MEWGLTVTSKPSEDLRLNPNPSGIWQTRPAEYHLTRMRKNAAFLFEGEKNVPIIDLALGKVKNTILLPYAIQKEQDRLHFTSNGFGYQVTCKGRKIIGGKISDSTLNPAFEIDAPCGFFEPLSTHIGFLEIIRQTPKLFVINPLGKSATFSCYNAYASEEKLYCVEPNPSDENTYLLTIRTMTIDDHVVSAPEKSVLLECPAYASIAGLCDNGQLIIKLLCMQRQ